MKFLRRENLQQAFHRKLSFREDDCGVAPLRALKWYERLAGVSFGFRGKLVSFHPKASTAGPSAGALEVYLLNLVIEHALANQYPLAMLALISGDPNGTFWLQRYRMVHFAYNNLWLACYPDLAAGTKREEKARLVETSIGFLENISLASHRCQVQAIWKFQSNGKLATRLQRQRNSYFGAWVGYCVASNAALQAKLMVDEALLSSSYDNSSQSNQISLSEAENNLAKTTFASILKGANGANSLGSIIVVAK
ncbi:hypothetical protein VNO77_22993 [Canavalia gladiata]|uniref:Uncharacterized protein n=1 Tax=Canavalia gladiata TaxID=3824 RepID=A0AAN9QB42_CANGL